LHEIFREGCQWNSEQMNKFWWRSGIPHNDVCFVLPVVSRGATLSEMETRSYNTASFCQSHSSAAVTGMLRDTYIYLYRVTADDRISGLTVQCGGYWVVCPGSVPAVQPLMD